MSLVKYVTGMVKDFKNGGTVAAGDREGDNFFLYVGIWIYSGITIKSLKPFDCYVFSICMEVLQDVYIAICDFLKLSSFWAVRWRVSYKVRI